MHSSGELFVLSPGNSGLMDNFQRQQSVWNLVKENVPSSELPEIRAVLGDALIDTYAELYSEVEMWEKIWLELHYSEQGSRPEAPVFPLADPPAVKELLKAEIQLLLLTLREKAARQGRDEEEVMALYNPSVVSYALSSSSTQRQGSPGSRCEKKSPSRPPSSQSKIGSRSISSLSSHSSCEEEIKALRHKLNITHIEEVVTHLRSVLTEESEALKRDVRVLQGNLETERANTQTEPVSPEPTLAELKEERRLIQRDLNVKSLINCSYNTINQSTRNRNLQIHAREMSGLALSANDSERPKPSNGTVPHLKPCPPRDTNHIRSDVPLISSSSAESTSPTSALEHGDKGCKHRGNSVRASAFRLVPAATVRASGSVKDFLLKMEVTRNGDHLQPAPPAVQRTASRRQRGNRHPCVPQPNSLLTSL
ncbi:coiled-coil domain-containing protein 24 [Rhinichthys klamathensis goyatoka]|uniref:coiled-coil domain-containing protein 24 n=1 Tax=Rhinichthys klamathensis goyatoka TaxID=3034132 RepID=UPI0024B55F68|nr:coiled-coil domain-containing protein 24 [Rhinichthys klamathensis goyatoka]